MTLEPTQFQHCSQTRGNEHCPIAGMDFFFSSPPLTYIIRYYLGCLNIQPYRQIYIQILNRTYKYKLLRHLIHCFMVTIQDSVESTVIRVCTVCGTFMHSGRKQLNTDMQSDSLALLCSSAPISAKPGSGSKINVECMQL